MERALATFREILAENAYLITGTETIWRAVLHTAHCRVEVAVREFRLYAEMRVPEYQLVIRKAETTDIFGVGELERLAKWYDAILGKNFTPESMPLSLDVLRCLLPEAKHIDMFQRSPNQVLILDRGTYRAVILAYAPEADLSIAGITDLPSRASYVELSDEGRLIEIKTSFLVAPAVERP